MTIRDARDDEDEALRALTFAAYAEYATLMEPSAWEGLRAALLGGLERSGSAERIVAERDGRLVGSVLLFPATVNAYRSSVTPGEGPEVRLLSVHPEARGLGVGRSLMDECVRRARRIGAPELRLHTSESMRAAIRLYEWMGFERVPERDFRPPGAELVQAYRLRLN